MSQILAAGVSALHPTARVGALLGALVGISLVLVERWAPKRLVPYIPSPSGLGLAMVLPAYNAVSIFLGSLCAELLRRRNKDLADRAVVPISSGFIAGESLMGILVAILAALGVMGK